MSKAVLVDTVKCIGCRGCQVACKSWNGLPGETTSNSGSYENPPQLSAVTFTRIKFNELQYKGKLHWVFTKVQCMHCQYPGCAEACLVGALQKSEEGPVVYDEGKCIGCRYCMVACPFSVPTFEWDDPLPWIRKCNFCFDRLGAGMEPACVKTCPTNALIIGERDNLLFEAKTRIESNPDRYIDHIYGENEIGGTSWLYLSAVPFEDLGFPSLSSTPITVNTERGIGAVPPVVVTVAALMSAVYWIARRKKKLEQENHPRHDNGTKEKVIE
ncbi:MAG: 4Fe-4S dicluster domain-containing protein [Dehalococcoidales bacterium]|nr:MAG: 4Fe-4S dicluster domain-containing protein [Dehalococcoidales bacterium]